MPYAALQMLKSETPHEVVFAFATTAGVLGYTFKRLETLGTLGIGSSQFLRFRTSCNREHIKAVADKLGRECVVPGPVGVYRGFLKRSPVWTPVPAATLQAVPQPGYKRMYRGPGEPFWEQQFGEKA